MDIQFYGANCIILTTKKSRIVIDDNLTDLGAKTVAKEGDVALFTSPHASPKSKVSLLIDMPGEYEVADASIQGIAARAHIDEDKTFTATMYKITLGDVRVLVTGHIYPELSEKQLEEIGIVDLLIIPVGGNGYTLDPVGAFRIVKKVEPKMVIPTHYDMPLEYVVPQQPLSEAAKTFGIEPTQAGAKIKVRPVDFTEDMQFMVLDRL